MVPEDSLHPRPRFQVGATETHLVFLLIPVLDSFLGFESPHWVFVSWIGTSLSFRWAQSALRICSTKEEVFMELLFWFWLSFTVSLFSLESLKFVIHKRLFFRLRRSIEECLGIAHWLPPFLLHIADGRWAEAAPLAVCCVSCCYGGNQDTLPKESETLILRITFFFAASINFFGSSFRFFLV